MSNLKVLKGAEKSKTIITKFGKKHSPTMATHWEANNRSTLVTIGNFNIGGWGWGGVRGSGEMMKIRYRWRMKWRFFNCFHCVKLSVHELIHFVRDCLMKKYDRLRQLARYDAVCGWEKDNLLMSNYYQWRAELRWQFRDARGQCLPWHPPFPPRHRADKT